MWTCLFRCVYDTPSRTRRTADRAERSQILERFRAADPVTVGRYSDQLHHAMQAAGLALLPTSTTTATPTVAPEEDVAPASSLPPPQPRLPQPPPPPQQQQQQPLVPLPVSPSLQNASDDDTAAEAAQVSAGLGEVERQLEQVADKLGRLEAQRVLAADAVAAWRRRFWLAFVPLLLVALRYVLVPRLLRRWRQRAS
jgi:hypothetical protein